MSKFLLFFLTLLNVHLSAQNDDLMENYYPDRTQGVLEQALAKGSNQVLCGRIKIKEGALKEVHHWFNTLSERKEELIEAFTQEGVWLESVFLEHTQNGDYLIYYTRQDDLEKVYAIIALLELPVRLFHVECWKKYCEECIVLKPLFDLQRTSH
ncbi:MAG TPA: DUF6176 family protein [Rhabdochlamydiaceae bacterium]|nr:DUF6176 family protein [Rhabdochlamydiaceae bacterium]